MPNEFIPELGPIELGPEWKLQLDHYLQADYNDIRIASEELPPVIEWINCQLQSLTEEKIIKKQKIKEVEANAFFDLLRGGYEEKFGGKMTDAKMAHAVNLDPRVIKVHEQYAVLVGWCQRLNGTLATFQCKLDLVRSTEATRRKLEPSDTD